MSQTVTLFEIKIPKNLEGKSEQILEFLALHNGYKKQISNPDWKPRNRKEVDLYIPNPESPKEYLEEFFSEKFIEIARAKNKESKIKQVDSDF